MAETWPKNRCLSARSAHTVPQPIGGRLRSGPSFSTTGNPIVLLPENPIGGILILTAALLLGVRGLASNPGEDLAGWRLAKRSGQSRGWHHRSTLLALFQLLPCTNRLFVFGQRGI